MALPSIDEFRSMKDDKQVEARRKHLQLIQQASVAAGSLTGVDRWDLFLTYVSAALEESSTQVAALRDKIADPSVVDTTEIFRLKILLEGWTQRGNAFKAIIGLPKDLLEQGEDAQALLDRMPAK